MTTINEVNIYEQIFRTCGTSFIDKTRKYVDHIQNFISKPHTGVLWSSPINKDCYRWSEFCHDQERRLKTLRTHVDFKLKTTAKVLFIQSALDIVTLPYTQSRDLFEYPVDWDEVFKTYDAVYVDYSKLRKNYWDDKRTNKQIEGNFADIYDVDTLMIRNLDIIEIVDKVRVFSLESNIKTTTEVTKKFFENVKKFTFSIHGNKALFKSVDNEDMLLTSEVLNLKEIIQDTSKQYYRIVTQNSVINIWTDQTKL